MKLEDCINDPKFRREFVTHEMDNLKKTVEGNENMLYHNDAKISILQEILDKLDLTKEEEGIVKEHMGALKGIKSDVNDQSARLDIMVEIYRKFKKRVLDNNLKLA